MIFDIQRNSFVDGPGIRTTVFFKGCNLRCKWCHNPESQSFEKQMMFYKDKCTGCGKCREVCPNHLKKCDFCGKCELYCPADARKVCGREYTPAEVFAEVIKDKAFYDNSGGGVTFSGGECMLQLDFLCEILEKCKSAGIHTAVDTAGNVPWKSFEKILPFTDLFLYDIKAFGAELHRKGTGVSNELILENLKNLSGRADIIVRIPVIGGYNDNDEEIRGWNRALAYSKLLCAYTPQCPHCGNNLRLVESFGKPEEWKNKFLYLCDTCEHDKWFEMNRIFPRNMEAK